MPLVTSHTEQTLAQFMRDELSTTANELDTEHAAWTTPNEHQPPYKPLIAATLRAYKVADIVQATEIDKLEALARREVWRGVMNATVAFADATSAQGEALKFAQIHAQAVKMYALAKTEAAEYATPPSVSPSGSAGGTVAVLNEWVW